MERLCWWRWRSLGRRGVYHKLEALFGRGKLRDIMIWMGSSYMLLHGTVPLLLCVQWLVTKCTDSSKGQDFHPPKKAMMSETLTPRQRFRQFVPSLFVNGQTTSLLTSETEKELVSEDRGGMARRMYPLPVGRIRAKQFQLQRNRGQGMMRSSELLTKLQILRLIT